MNFLKSGGGERGVHLRCGSPLQLALKAGIQHASRCHQQAAVPQRYPPKREAMCPIDERITPDRYVLVVVIVNATVSQSVAKSAPNFDLLAATTARGSSTLKIAAMDPDFSCDINPNPRFLTSASPDQSSTCFRSWTAPGNRHTNIVERLTAAVLRMLR